MPSDLVEYLTLEEDCKVVLIVFCKEMKFELIEGQNCV